MSGTKPTDAPKVPWSAELDALAEKRRAEITAALEAAHGNILQTALALGTPRTSLLNWLAKYGLLARAMDLRIAAGYRGVGRPAKNSGSVKVGK